MIQHISQFTLCLITLKKPPQDEELPDDEEKPVPANRRIGFIVNEEES